MSPAALFLFFGHIVAQVARGHCAGPRGILRQVRHVEFEFVQQIVRRLELRLGLARKAHDDVGGDRGVGQLRSDFLDQAAIIVGGVAALHAAQHFVVAGLHRHFDVLAHLRQFGHRIEQLVVHPVRM